jgi:hypothetical protein
MPITLAILQAPHVRKFGEDTVVKSAQAIGAERDTAIFLALLVLAVLFVVIRWMTRRAPERNANPAERTFGITSGSPDP